MRLGNRQTEDRGRERGADTSWFRASIEPSQVRIEGGDRSRAALGFPNFFSSLYVGDR